MLISKTIEGLIIKVNLDRSVSHCLLCGQKSTIKWLSFFPSLSPFQSKWSIPIRQSPLDSHDQSSSRSLYSRVIGTLLSLYEILWKWLGEFDHQRKVLYLHGTSMIGIILYHMWILDTQVGCLRIICYTC